MHFEMKNVPLSEVLKQIEKKCPVDEVFADVHTNLFIVYVVTIF